MPSYEYIADWISCSVAVISMFCSLMTLSLIRRMRCRNGYFAIIASMTICELIYEFNFVLGVMPGYHTCVIKNILDVFGGLSFSLWSNILSFVVLYVVVSIRSIEVTYVYKYFALFSMIPPLILAIGVPFALEHSDEDDSRPNYCDYGNNSTATFVQNAYYWGRILTICVNFIAFFITSNKVSSMMQSVGGRKEAWTLAALGPIQLAQRLFRENDSGRATAVKQCLAIVILASRMKYYPLAQAVSRSGGAWNEFNNYEYSNAVSNFVASVLNPSQGIFDFIIFMIMQPKAWSTLREVWCCVSTMVHKDSIDLREKDSGTMSTSEIVRSPMASVDSEDPDSHASRISTASGRSSGYFGTPDTLKYPRDKAFDDLDDAELDNVINGTSSATIGNGDDSTTGASNDLGVSFTSLYLSSGRKSVSQAVNRPSASFEL